MKKYTLNDVKKMVYELSNNEYEVIEESFKTYSEPCLIHHKTCGRKYLIRLGDFKKGRRCNKCIRESKRLSPEKFKKRFYNKFKGRYELLSKYTTNIDDIIVKHLKCGNVYPNRPVDFMRRNGQCPFCRYKKSAKSNSKTHDEFKDEVNRITNGEYELLDNVKYINNHTKVNIHHFECNKSYKVRPYVFVNGKRCPICALKERESKGEKIINSWLIENNIDYERQVTFDECKNIHVLPFDFRIFYEDGTFCLIEYDGEFHYKPYSNSDKGKELLLRQQYRDSIKNKFCKDNSIDLLRIPYFEIDNIEDILNNYFF